MTCVLTLPSLTPDLRHSHFFYNVTISRAAPLTPLRSKKPAAAASTPPVKDGNNFRARRLSVSDIDTSEFEKAAKGTPTDGTKKGRRLSMRCARRTGPCGRSLALYRAPPRLCPPAGARKRVCGRLLVRQLARAPIGRRRPLVARLLARPAVR